MLLDVRNTDKKFNGVYALKDLNFSLGAGEIHGLVGENGAGKSTFIKILGGVYKRDGGSILWDGKELPEEIRPEESRNLGINIIFQDNVLIPAFTGAENICLDDSAESTAQIRLLDPQIVSPTFKQLQQSSKILLVVITSVE